MKSDMGLTKPPAQLTIEDCEKLLISDALFNSAKAFYNNDSWQNGNGWVGPLPDGNDQDVAKVMKEIEQALVSHPAAHEIPDRHMDAVIGSEPNWTLVVRRTLSEGEEPNATEQNLIDEATSALTAWWDDKETLSVLQDSAIEMLLGDRGCLRMLVPEGELTTVPAGGLEGPNGPDSVLAVSLDTNDLEHALEIIWPVFVEADQTAVVRDPLTMKKVGVYVYEVQDFITGGITQFAEITYVNDEDDTVIRTISQEKGANATVGDFTELALGKRLTIYEMKSRRLFTKPVLDNLKLLNMSNTMMGRNVVLGGFLERVILNGQMPGAWETSDTGERTFVPERTKVGASATNWIAGAITGKDSEGNPIVATPDIRWKDPVSTKTFTESSDAAYKNMLHGARQLHLLISGDAVASGESRKQARDDYEKSLKRTKSKIDAAGRWILETALFMAAVFLGEPEKFAGLRINFDAKVDAGPLAQGDRDSIRSEVQANLRSIDNAIVELRVSDDPDAEKKKILDEQQQGLNPIAAANQMIPGPPSNDPNAPQNQNPNAPPVPPNKNPNVLPPNNPAVA